MGRNAHAALGQCIPTTRTAHTHARQHASQTQMGIYVHTPWCVCVRARVCVCGRGGAAGRRGHGCRCRESCSQCQHASKPHVPLASAENRALLLAGSSPPPTARPWPSSSSTPSHCLTSGSSPCARHAWANGQAGQSALGSSQGPTAPPCLTPPAPCMVNLKPTPLPPLRHLLQLIAFMESPRPKSSYHPDCRAGSEVLLPAPGASACRTYAVKVRDGRIYDCRQRWRQLGCSYCCCSLLREPGLACYRLQPGNPPLLSLPPCLRAVTAYMPLRLLQECHRRVHGRAWVLTPARHKLAALHSSRPGPPAHTANRATCWLPTPPQSARTWHCWCRI